LRDHSHIQIEGSDVCAHCGQPLPAAAVPVYDRRASKRTGLVVTILLHLLLVAIYLFQPKTKHEKVAAPSSNEIVLLTPGKPKPQQQAPKSAPKTRPHRTPPEQVQVQRLPNTITLPHEKHVDIVREEPKKQVKEAPQEVDMQAYIEARRKQRGAPEPSQATEESDEAKGMRNALANIAAANNRGRDDSNETGGIFSVSNRTFHSAELRFRGWNPSFKRRWLTQLTVEQGSEPDLETAIVKKMIQLIRKERPGDFPWDSHRLGKVVTMSARPQDEAELQAFLMKEMFPENRAQK
jgi:type IV secretory pathway VirB10-like protein